MTHTERCGTGWVCRDCLSLLANGETDPNLTEEETREFLDRFHQLNEPGSITPGIAREEHSCASNYTVSSGDKHKEYRADNASEALEQAESEFPHDTTSFTVTAHELQTVNDRGGECECEYSPFAWSPCGGCGSNLGGDRYAVTFWK